MLGRYINDGVSKCRGCKGPLCERCDGIGFVHARSQFPWIQVAMLILTVALALVLMYER